MLLFLYNKSIATAVLFPKLSILKYLGFFSESFKFKMYKQILMIFTHHQVVFE